MKRLMLIMPVLIVAIALFMFANSEQGATIRADVRKRVAQAIDSAKAMALPYDWPMTSTASRPYKSSVSTRSATCRGIDQGPS